MEAATEQAVSSFAKSLFPGEIHEDLVFRVTLDLDQVERNDDDRMVAIAKLAYKRGEYGYAFFED